MFSHFHVKDCLIKENSCLAVRINIPELRLVNSDFPTDDVGDTKPSASIHSVTQYFIYVLDNFIFVHPLTLTLSITSTVQHFGEIVSTARA